MKTKTLLPGTRVCLSRRPMTLDKRCWPQQGATGIVVPESSPIEGTAMVCWDNGPEGYPEMLCSVKWLEAVK